MLDNFNESAKYFASLGLFLHQLRCENLNLTNVSPQSDEKFNRKEKLIFDKIF